MQNIVKKESYIKINYSKYFTAYEISQILIGIDDLVKEARTNTTSEAYNSELPEHLQIEIEKSSLKILPVLNKAAVIICLYKFLGADVKRLSDNELSAHLKITESFNNNTINLCVVNCGNVIIDYDNNKIKKRSTELNLEKQGRGSKIIPPQHKFLESVHIRISKGSFTSKTINYRGKIKNGAGIKIQSGVFLDTQFKDKDVKIEFHPPKKLEIEAKFAEIKISDAHNYTLFADGFIVLAGDDSRPIAFQITNLTSAKQDQ